MIKAIMNVDEVADYLGFSSKKIYNLIESYKIPASKIGGQYRFAKDLIDKWVKDQSIVFQLDWGTRLQTLLDNMRQTSSENNITQADIDDAILEVRQQKQRRANS